MGSSRPQDEEWNIVHSGDRRLEAFDDPRGQDVLGGWPAISSAQPSVDKPTRIQRSLSSPLRPALNTSPKDDMPQSTQRKNALRLLSKRVRQIGRLTDEIILKRYALEHEEQTLESCESFIRESSNELIDTVTSLDEDNLISWQTKLVDLRSRMHGDSEAFRNQASRVKELRNGMIRLQSRLKDKCDKLTQFLDSADISLSKRTFSHFKGVISESDSGTISAASSVGSATHPLLAKFFDRKGDIGVFRERLQELEYHYHEGLAEREFISDRGDSLEVSDEQYYNDFVAQQRIILDDLERAERDADSLAEQCKAAGLSLAENRRGSLSEASSVEQESSLARVGMSSSKPLPPKTPRLKETTLLSPRSNRWVRGWLEGLQLPDNNTGISRTVEDEKSLSQAPETRDQATPPAKPPLWRPWSEDPSNATGFRGVDRSKIVLPNPLDDGTPLLRWMSDPPKTHLLPQAPDGKQDVVVQRRRSSQGDAPAGHAQQISSVSHMLETGAGERSRFSVWKWLPRFWPRT